MSFPGVVIPKIEANPTYGLAPLTVDMIVAVDEYDEIIETNDESLMEAEICEDHTIVNEEIVEVN